MPYRQLTNNWIAGLLLGAAVVMTAALVWIQSDQSRLARMVQPQVRVIQYRSPWHPTRYDYFAGEEVFFSVDRQSLVNPDSPVGLKVTTSWQEVGTGITYPADDTELAHHVRVPRAGVIGTRRHLQAYMLPDRYYQLVGIAETVTPTIAPSVELFTSEPIFVRDNGFWSNPNAQ